MPASPRVLLANEPGGGRGRVTTLRAVALSLGPGLPLVAALGRMAYAGVLADIFERVLPDPPMIRMQGSSADPHMIGNATSGDTITALGLAASGMMLIQGPVALEKIARQSRLT